MLADERFEMQARYEYVSLGAATARLLSQWLAGRIRVCCTHLAHTAAQVGRRMDGWHGERVPTDWSGAERADPGR